MALTPSERSLLGKAAAHSSWANTDDRSARTTNARAAMDQKFLDQAGGDPEKAAHLRKAHFANLSLKSATSRRKAKEAREEAARVERELVAYGEPANNPDFNARREQRVRRFMALDTVDPSDVFAVKWGPEDGEWVATCNRFPSMSWLAPSPAGALDGLLEAMVGDESHE